MKYYLIYILPFVFIAFLWSGCADLQSDISTPEEINYHGPGINNPGHPNFHGKLVRSLKWDLRQCESCHGADLKGGRTGADCTKCHTNSDGPKACNTCHGQFSDPSRIAPPRDINGNTLASARGVGAHVQHLYERVLGQSARCGSCHIFPQNIYDPTHMLNDTLPAEVNFKNKATLFGADNAAYDYSTGTCSNTYCHGNFTFEKSSADSINWFAYTGEFMKGTPKTVTWTKVGQGEAECGSCHGLPPEGHITEGITINTCYQCHQGVVDENGKIVDIEKHINGEKNSRGNYIKP